MRPLELTIEGLRSFRAPVTLDLRGRDQIAIVGDTGAGKSSIIEAMTYALYGQATFSGLNRELMNDAAGQLRVVLRFRTADEEWEVARTLRRRASGAIGAQSAQLRRFGADGALLEMVEQARPVNERIEQVVGLNRDAFLRTTVLPQGRFAQLLVEDDPRVRSTILRQVWRTDELEEAGRIAAAAHGELATLRARLDQAAAVYPEDPRAHLEQLHQQAQQAGRAAAGAEQTEQAAVGALQAVTVAVQQSRRAHAATERLGAFQAAALTATVAPLAAVAERIDQQESELCRRQAALAEELAAIPADDDGPSPAEVTGALTTLAGIPALARDAREADGQLRERRAAAEHSTNRRRAGRPRGATGAATTGFRASARPGTGAGTAGRGATARATRRALRRRATCRGGSANGPGRTDPPRATAAPGDRAAAGGGRGIRAPRSDRSAGPRTPRSSATFAVGRRGSGSPAPRRRVSDLQSVVGA